jgi:hypothetical protein
VTGAFQLTEDGRWIPARRYKRPDEYTLWERIAFWRELPLVSQETADREHAEANAIETKSNAD